MGYETEIDNAINWARLHLDSTDYRLRCLAFVEDAYERSNGIEMWGGDDANQSAKLYEVHKNKGLPPKGAFVFYSCSGLVDGEIKNWGHVGLSLGKGDTIHAWDKVRLDHYLEIENLHPAQGWTQPVFIGWAPVERILAGMQNRQWD